MNWIKRYLIKYEIWQQQRMLKRLYKLTPTVEFFSPEHCDIWVKEQVIESLKNELKELEK